MDMAETKTTYVAHRPLARPNRRVADSLLVVTGLGALFILAIFIHGESAAVLREPDGILLAISRLCALVGTYLMLIMVVLISRLPWLERTVGQDRLVQWHRKLGPWPLWLISIHVVFVLMGYARQANTGIVHEAWTFITSYPDILAAMVGYGLLMMAGITSIRIARRRLKYETWWVVHLYLYLALALAFAHQIVTGVFFITSPLSRDVWIALWIFAASSVFFCRIGIPVVRNFRHRLRVATIREETPGVFSVICSGRRIEKLAIAGGQFFQWRFLTRELWWHAHPYSLSALPRPPYIRFTVKALGDQSRAVANLAPGTRVLIEGPYGAFTDHVRRSTKVALIGAGVGITPLRALLEDLPKGIDVTVILRASSDMDLVHRDEIAALVKEHDGQFHTLTGPRQKIRFDAKKLLALIPDIALRDVYICGPEGFNEMIGNHATRLGVPIDRIHHEVFAF